MSQHGKSLEAGEKRVTRSEREGAEACVIYRNERGKNSQVWFEMSLGNSDVPTEKMVH